MLLFLDLDGVMIPAKPWKRPEFMEDGFPAFSKAAVDSLNILLVELGVSTILLTSSHKANHTPDQWRDIFNLRGIRACLLRTLPENPDLLDRHQEMLRWLQENPPQSDFIIIDDDASLHDLPSAIKKHVLQPVSMIGLTPELVRAFIRERGR